jgi:hypothetical protein
MIQYRNTIEAIYLHLDEVQQLVANFGTRERIPSIEVDLAMDKLRNVYDLMLSLRLETIQENHVPDQSVDVPFEVEVQNTAEEQKMDTALPKENLISESIKSRIYADERESIEETKEKTKAEKESRVRVPQTNVSSGEGIKEKSFSKEDSLQKSGDISTYIKSKPIANISNALGLNEKFELIQNLFGGDKIRFEQTMNYLNAASDFNEAYEYLANNFKWDMDDTYVQRILELLRRKLIVKKNDR